jgi:hypothetical protein
MPKGSRYQVVEVDVKEKQIVDGVPFVIHTDRILRVTCCQCGKKHYQTFKVISEKVIEINMTSKNGVDYIKDVAG